jgi:flagellar basal body rod protein FlgC
MTLEEAIVDFGRANADLKIAKDALDTSNSGLASAVKDKAKNEEVYKQKQVVFDATFNKLLELHKDAKQ